MKIYINRKVLWGLIISIIIIIGLGALSYWYFLSLSEATRWTNHARRVLQNVEEVRSTIVQIENSQRGFSLSGDEKFLDTHKRSLRELDELVDEIDNATRDNEVQQVHIDSLRPLLKNFTGSSSSMIQNRGAAIIDGPVSKIHALLNDIKEEEQSLILSRSLSVQRGFYRFVYAFIGLLVVTLLVLIGIAWMINANTRSRTLAEQKVRDAELETQKINHDLEAFSYSVSHDLRSPLRSINGYSQILIEDYSDKIDAEGNRLLNVIISNAKKMGQLIDDLLEFSRLGRMEIRRSTVNIEDQVRTIAAELVAREEGRNIELKVHKLGTAAIDGNLMRQVWINLLSNALKYSRNKDITIVEIGRIDDTSKRQSAVFFVKDNGAGFDMAYMDKLFGVFQRLHKVNEFEGTGVGLALVKRIIDRHNGRAWAEGKVGEGATFYIELPVE